MALGKRVLVVARKEQGAFLEKAKGGEEKMRGRCDA